MIEIKFHKENNKSVAYDNKIVIGKCEYIEVQDVWNITHTIVNELYQGQGIARRLVENIIENAQKYNKKLIADCSYARKIIEKNSYEFFIAGRTRNKENILKICNIFDEFNISYYCFIKNEKSFETFGTENQSIEEKQETFEKLNLKSEVVLNIFNEDMEAEKKSKNLLLVLPAGKSGHIEAGVAYGLGKKCYAIGQYDATDSLYNIFEQIFSNEAELREFLKNYK